MMPAPNGNTTTSRPAVEKNENAHDSCLEGTWYEIRVKGHLGPEWADWFAGLEFKPFEDGQMLLFGRIVDQAAHRRLDPVESSQPGITLGPVTRRMTKRGRIWTVFARTALSSTPRGAFFIWWRFTELFHPAAWRHSGLSCVGLILIVLNAPAS
jgi:hypothetical protein